MKNLFDNPTTLRNPADFVGRRDQLGRIFGLLKSRQSVSLVGPRRIGKTSLLNCLRSPYWHKQFQVESEHFLFFYLDLQKHSLKARFDLFDEVYKLIKTYISAQGYDVIEEGLDKDDELHLLLEQMHSHGLHPVLILDTFDEIIQYGPISSSVFGYLRSLGTGGYLSYVVASVEELGVLFRKLFPEESRPSPFPNIFATVRLGSFSVAEAQEMLTQTSTRGGLPFTEDEKQWVAQLAGTHPFVLQQVATLLFEQKRLSPAREVDRETIQGEARRNLISHFDDCWNMLSPKEQKALIANIKQRPTQSMEPKRKAQNARQAGQEKPEFQDEWENQSLPEMARNELFLEYLREAGLLEIYPLALKDALEHFDHPSALGESALISLLPFIEKRMEQQNAQTLTTRGRVLQDILHEALENMRGQGKRTDGARDWMYYNILYYRYFNQKRDLKLELVASRLLISDRQYYRNFPKALEQLWKELQTMDAISQLQEFQPSVSPEPPNEVTR